ncbi:MAG: ABC transporter ATP-binding protein [Planctomycetota bacterium]
MNNPPSDAPLVELRKIDKTFLDGGQRLEVLRGLDLAVYPGESVSILGRSGSGKSTLLHILGLLDPASGGEYLFRGKEVAALPERARNRIRSLEIGFVFQHYHLLPELTVLENVLLPARVAGRGSAARARALLASVGLSDRAGKKPRTLSGGEAQRAAIARALMNRPALVLCDEPTGNLDAATAGGVLDVLFALEESAPATLLLVTHDQEVASRSGRTLFLEDGRLHSSPLS